MDNKQRYFQTQSFIDYNPYESLKKGAVATKIEMADIEPFTRNIKSSILSSYKGGTKFRNNDTILARITPCLENGKCAFIQTLPNESIGFGSTEFIVMRAVPGISIPLYIYYFALSPKFREITIKSLIGTSGRQRVQVDVLKNYCHSLPSLSVQKQIVSILSSFDDKIEINNKIIANLEAQAQALYKSWFIDFDPFQDGEFQDSELGMIPKGWKIGLLSDIIEFNPSEKTTKNDNFFIDMKSLPTRGFIISDISKKNKRSGMKFRNNDVLIARITPCLENGKTGIVFGLPDEEVGIGSTEFIVMRGKHGKQLSYCACTARNDKFRKYAVSHMNGTSGRQRVSASSLEEYSIVVPPALILKAFEEILGNSFQMMENIRKQNQILAELRDTLLPKLMSGEIELPDITED